MQTNEQGLDPINPAAGELGSVALFIEDIPSSSGKIPDWKTDATADATISSRVHVSLLDSLMALAGELVLSRNQLLQTISATFLHPFRKIVLSHSFLRE